MKTDCFFCGSNHEFMKYSTTYNQAFSWVCLEDALEVNPKDPQALAISNEFNHKENSMKVGF